MSRTTKRRKVNPFPATTQLINLVTALNPNHLTLGPGMMAQLQHLARLANHEILTIDLPSFTETNTNNSDG